MDVLGPWYILVIIAAAGLNLPAVESAPFFHFSTVIYKCTECRIIRKFHTRLVGVRPTTVIFSPWPVPFESLRGFSLYSVDNRRRKKAPMYDCYFTWDTEQAKAS